MVIVTQWFPPEHAPIGYMLKEVAGALASGGHDVTVVTGFPNHPAGIVFPGFRKRWIQREALGKISILRTWLFTSRSRSLFSRASTFLSFTATATWAVLRHPRPDVIFALFQPLTVGLTLPVVGMIRRSRIVLGVQDLHPDALISMGLVRNPAVVLLLRWLERWGYRNADGLVVISRGFREHVLQRGASADRIAVIENWIDTDDVSPADRDNDVRLSLGAGHDTFVVLYAGTIGHASGAEIVLDAAALLCDDPAIRIAFVGEGPLVPALKRRVISERLPNVVFLPFQPRERLSAVQACADVGIVSLRPGQGQFSVPSKVLGYMAAGRAVIASVDGDSETAHLIERADCGVVVPAGDAVALAAQIRALRADPQGRAKLGSRGRGYVVTNCAKEIMTQRYLDFFATVARQ